MTMALSNAPAVAVSGVSHFVTGASVLRNISFTVEQRQIFGIVGAVGSGKTTLARLLSTARPPHAGSIAICGFDTVLEAERARWSLGYLPHPAVAYANLSVAEYLEFFQRAGMASETIRIDQVLQRTRLQHRKHALIASLNEGQRQRLGLARALLHDPSVLILDEPISKVDPMRRDALIALLRELRDSGKTIVLLSPILSGVAELCDRIGILHAGRLLASGTVDEIIEESGQTSLRSGLSILQDRLSLEYPAEDRRSYLDPMPAKRLLSSVRRASSTPPPPVEESHKRLRLRSLSDPAQVKAVLSESREVVSVEALPDGSVLIAYQGDETAVADLIEKLVQRGVRIISAEPQHTELERIFRSLTGGPS
ncbi:MAG TPA: ABC transporter ATP-binding protein [Polyangiaceae bacterium]|nr:ABC transporter ATP-binding protein [Polyangiaceae bacterium]